MLEEPATYATVLIVVKPGRAVEVVLRSLASVDVEQPTFTTMGLPEFLVHFGGVIAAHTPIARLDVVRRDRANDFYMNGPVPAAHLPVGSVLPVDAAAYTFDRQPWYSLGSSTLVSIDVYLSLVCQVGGSVHLVGGHPSAPADKPLSSANQPIGQIVIDPTTVEGSAIVDLFAWIKCLERADGSWPGGDVVEELARWFVAVGIDPDESSSRLFARLNRARRT